MAPRSLVFLLVAFTFSGCVAPSPEVGGHDDETHEDSQDPGGPRFLDPVQIAPLESFVALAQSELFVAITGEEVVACTHGLFTGPSPMWASVDGGTMFQALSPAPTTGPSGDCEVAVGADGTWYFLHSTLESATLASTIDRGASWTVNHATALPTTGMADRPWLHAMGNDLLMTYHDISLGPGAGAITRSTDGGATWSTPQFLALPGADHQHVLLGHPSHVPGTDRVYVPILRFTPDAPSAAVGAPSTVTALFAMSEDRGVTWTEIPVPGIDRLAGQTPVGAGADGNGTLFFAGVSPDDGKVLLTASVDGGSTWTPVVEVDESTAAGEVWFDGRSEGGTLAWTGIRADTGTRNLTVARLGATGQVEDIQALWPAEDSEYLAVDHADERAFVVYAHDDGAYLLREA